MDLLDVSKENIQPLKRGRNISTLSTALLAQTDAELYQQLMKEREEFEVLVRSYSGDDPLKPWYDYVQWVEQNFPKHGREGNLKVLLGNCLAQFKDSEQYLQDVRFIDLWTRYMSFADDPLEMYKQIHARGIGNQCAIFYQCWAEEYEQANDIKRADQIFIEGIRRNAQPLDELISAHNNFQVRVARRILGENPIDHLELATERTALSTLRAHGRRRNMVDSTRVGHSVKQTTPGVLRPFSNSTLGERRNGNVQFSKITVFNDENAPLTDAVANPQVKPSGSLTQQNANKENMLKPGRWNEGKFKKKSSTPAAGISNVPATPRNPVFQVHVDENSDVPKTPKTDIVVSNVLKVRKHVYEDEKSIPIAIFEPHDPSKVPMYPKSKVYCGGTEFSLEELRAIIYLQKEKERKKVSHQKECKDLEQEKIFHSNMQIVDDEVFELNEKRQFSADEHQSQLNVPVKKVHIPSEKIQPHQEEFRKSSFEVFVEPEEEMDAKLKLENRSGKQSIVAPFQKESMPVPTAHQTASRKSSFEVFVEPEEEMDAKLKPENQPNIQLNVVEKERRPVPTPAQILGDVQFSGCLKVPQLLKKRKGSSVQSEDENVHSMEQKDIDQSLTVNTKAIINDVKDMWISSPQEELKFARASFIPKVSMGCKPVPQETESIIQPTTPFTPFKIFSDVSGIGQEVNSINVHVDEESGELPQPIQTSCVQMTGNSSSQKGGVGFSRHQHQVILHDRIQTSTVLSKDEFDAYLPMKQNPPPNANMTASINFQLVLQKEEILRSSNFDVIKCQQMLGSKPQEEMEIPNNSFIVYGDPSAKSQEEHNEVSNPAMGIPFVPSPGMTPAQLAALENTEDKENMLLGKQEQRTQYCRSKKSILQPSKDVYFVPLEEQQQQLAEEVMVQQNPFSDETCCTEAFALPLVSSTPMVNSQFKYMDQEGRNDDVIDNTVQLMNLCANMLTPSEKNLPITYGSSPPKSFAVLNDQDMRTELPSSMHASEVQRSQLSVILELSEQKRSFSTGTTDGSNSSKSTGFEEVHKNTISRHFSPARSNIPLFAEKDIQEGVKFLKNGIPSPTISDTLFFFSDNFRVNCLAKVEFPSERHRLHCEQLSKSLDTIRKGGVLFVGRNHYSISSVSQMKGYEFCMAVDTSSNKRMEFEVKDNNHLWEQYIREEIRLRIQDSSMIKHFIANEKTFIFLNKHLVLYQVNKYPRKSLKEVLQENFLRMGGQLAEADILNQACQIIEIVHCLHQCNIVHGSLSLLSFMCVSGKPCFLLLSDFEKAVDMTLLSPDITFDATEKPLYSAMNASRVSPFQIDYIALANIFHCLIFGEPIRVRQERGMWCITRIFPGNFKERLWKKVFGELLNSSYIDLLLLMRQ